MSFYIQNQTVGVDPQNIYKQSPATHDYSYNDFLETPIEYSTLPESKDASFFNPSTLEDASSDIYGAVYSGVPVFEMMCRNIAVMRRRSDSYLNATQILKVAGIDKGRRTKILEKEIQNGSHVKVQGGYGKYQGTWIPFERGVQLARHYRVEELLNPLFTYKSAMGRLDKTPTKEQVMSVNRESKKSKKAREDGHDNLGEQKRKKPKPTKYHNDVSFNDSQLAPHSFELPFYPPSEDLGQSHPSFDLQFAYPQDYSNYYNMPQSSFEHVPVIVENPSERHRSTLISMFMSEDDTAIPDILFPHVNVPDFDIDLILDEHGHTAIHWAAALGRIQILQLLIQKGANINALNFNGETALIRSVMVLHNFDRLTFPQVVNVLRDQLSIPDKKNRNVLHHICLAAAVKTSSQSCRYYMEYLLDFLIRNQKSENENYRDDLFSTINMVDICGDTPLNIAARIGNRFLVDQLLNLGADSTIPNRSGLTPADFNNGTLLEQNSSSITLKVDSNQEYNDDRMRIIYPSIQNDEETSAAGLTGAIEEKNSHTILAETQYQMREMVADVTKLRDQNQTLKSQLSQIPKLLLKIKNLEEALNQVSSLPSPSEDMNSLDSLSHSEALKHLKKCRQDLKTSQEIEKRAREQLSKSMTKNIEKEYQCKKIISSCCNIHIEEVDEIIPQLLEAIESDDADLDESQIATFMAQFRRQSASAE